MRCLNLSVAILVQGFNTARMLLLLFMKFAIWLIPYAEGNARSTGEPSRKRRRKMFLPKSPYLSMLLSTIEFTPCLSLAADGPKSERRAARTGGDPPQKKNNCPGPRIMMRPSVVKTMGSFSKVSAHLGFYEPKRPRMAAEVAAETLPIRCRTLPIFMFWPELIWALFKTSGLIGGGDS